MRERRWWSRWGAVGVLLAAAVLVSSCVPSVTGGARRPGYLVVALKEAPTSLDPTQSSSYVARIVFANMCEKLYDVDKNLHLVPQLAAAMPRITDGGRTYTIRLRKGVRFNDGTPMTAESVVRTVRRNKNNKLSERASELTAVSSAKAVRPLTVRLRLSRPFAPLTSILADRSGMVLSPKALRRSGDDFAQNPVCVGPFKFASRPSADEINLSRSPYYYDRDKVKLPGVTFRAVPQDNVRAADLRSGDVDVIDRASPQDLESLKADRSLRVRPVTSLGYEGITVNIGNANGSKGAPAAPDTPLARHPKLLKAFELSLDRRVINKVVYDGAYVPDCSPIPPTSPWAVPVQCSHRDVAKARRLVRESGVRAPIPVTLTVQNSALSEQLGTIVQAMAKKAGFAVQVQPSEFTTALARAKKGKIDTFQVGWSGRLDPDQNISQQVLPGSALNYSGMHDPEITRLVKQARTATGRDRRKQLYTQLIGRLNKELGIIYLYHEKYVLGLRKEVSGVHFYGDGLIRLKTAKRNG